MSDTRNETVSVVERTHSVAASGPVIAAHFLGKTAVFALAEEAIVLAEPTGEPKTVATMAKSSQPTPKGKAET